MRIGQDDNAFIGGSGRKHERGGRGAACALGAARRALVGELIAQARAFNALRPLRLLEEYLQTLAS